MYFTGSKNTGVDLFGYVMILTNLYINKNRILSVYFFLLCLFYKELNLKDLIKMK